MLILAHLLLVLGDGPQVGLHLGALRLQQGPVLGEDVGVGDGVQVGGAELGELFGRLVADGV